MHISLKILDFGDSAEEVLVVRDLIRLQDRIQISLPSMDVPLSLFKHIELSLEVGVLGVKILDLFLEGDFDSGELLDLT